MMLSDYEPNYSGVALCNAEIIRQLDVPNPGFAWASLLQAFLGTGYSERIIVEYAYPVTWAAIYGVDTFAIWCSGIRTDYAGRQLVDAWLHPSVPGTVEWNDKVDEWAGAIFAKCNTFGPIPTKPKYRMAGHSLGGAIAMRLASIYAESRPSASHHCCTFGMPKAIDIIDPFLSQIKIGRWINPLDNVSSLPPLYDQGVSIFVALTYQEWFNLQRWRHPCQAYNVNASGAMSKIDDPPSVVLNNNTLLQACNSPQGMFGTGHGIETYIANLRAAATPVSSATPSSTIAPTTPMPALPTPAIIAPSPPTPPAPVSPAVVAAAITVYNEQVALHDNVSNQVPSLWTMKAVRHGPFWHVEWMDRTVAIGPTKKKSRALARHMNRFLRIYQGVAQSQGQNFCDALTGYLTVAATPGLGFDPTLADGGFAPEFSLPDE